MSELVKAGRPSEYNSTYSERFLEYAEKGHSIMEIAAKLKKSRDTIYRWAKEIPEFSDAFKKGKEWSEAKNAEIIKAIALGQVPKANVAAYQMYMRNTAGWDKYQGAEGNNFNQTINIGSMNILQDKSTQELIEHIKSISLDVSEVIDIEEYELLPDAREPTERETARDS